VNSPVISYGRDVCADLTVASAHEWLVTNGIGGYASGTVDGSATRRYHGWLVAALAPPAGRMLFVSKLDERIEYRGVSWALATNRWASGSIEPAGYLNIERFSLEDGAAVWNFALGDALIERRIAMEPGANVSAVRYRVLRADGPLRFIIKALVDYRDFHATSQVGDRELRVELIESAVRVAPKTVGATPIWLTADRGDVRVENAWYRDYDLPAERARGLDDREDHLLAATFSANLADGEALTVRLSAAASRSYSEPAAIFERDAADEREILAAWERAAGRAARTAPLAVRRLVLAADSFVVARPVAGFPDGRTIIAGYHWFADWGRDAMIALPGLTLTTGRFDLARDVLRTFDRFVDRGMLPNDFSERGGAPEYNDADAALWFIEAVRAYLGTSGDRAALAEFWTTLVAIVDAYERGTRFGIGVDAADGLLRAGVSGAQVTWMDAKVGDDVITPRIGKPVEINALWYNALRALAELAPRAGADPARYAAAAERVCASFGRFDETGSGGLFDVIDGPGGDDASIRPNQIFAVSLHYSPLSLERQRAVVDLCARELLTSHGLRTLSPRDPRYLGKYAGAPAARDRAYHQGTVWPWLIGPFALAHARAHGNREAALAFLEPLLEHVLERGVGTLPELAAGDPPFAFGGAIAQAWSVAEVLRAWHLLRDGG
jgi:predicted glycogen debranching enzyme